jgi:hypothetical protein
MAKPDPNADPVNDRNEGMLRDPVVWGADDEGNGGEIVSYVKDIGNGDPGYNANIRQVLIMKQDGTEQVVPESEIVRNRETVVRSREPNRRPDATFPAAAPGDGTTGTGDDNPQSRPDPSSGEDLGKANQTEGASAAPASSRQGASGTTSGRSSSSKSK